MNKPVTNNDVIRSLQERLKAIDYDRANVVKAINLLTATELVAQDATIKAKLTAKQAKKPTAKRKLPPWSPAVNASPYVQVLYDALEDGSSLTTADLLQRVHSSGYYEVTQNQVSGSLSWMRSSGRLTRASNQWRRKHARHQNGKATAKGAETSSTVKPLRTEEMGSLAHAVANANQ